MFKSKGSIYILFPVVVIIWGAIIYKVLVAFGEDAIILPEISTTKFKSRETIKKDTFSLLPVHRDPFLGHAYNKPLRTKDRAEVEKINVVWPEIFYNGIISGEGTASAVFIINLNGRQILMEKGTTAEGLTVVGGNATQVKLKYQGAIKGFLKTD